MTQTTQTPIQLHTLPGALGIRSLSPFGLKVESLLRLAGVPYEVVPDSPMNGPRKKLPFTVQGDEVVADSGNITQKLVDDGTLDLPAGPFETLVIRTIEEHLCFFAVHFLFAYEGEAVKQVLLAEVPAFLRSLIFGKMNKGLQSNLFAQGTGRRPDEEMLRMARADFGALTRLLNDQKFFAGETPGIADASAHGLFSQFLGEGENPLSMLFREHDALVRYHARVERFIYGDVRAQRKAA